MSATGRGTIREPRDFYATPESAFAPLLGILPRVNFWEPCAGDGRIIRWLLKSGRHADGADLNPQAGWRCKPVDYLKDQNVREFTITNPPFSVAFEMCRHGVIYSRELMLLLRLNFLASEERGDWFTDHEPSALFVLKKRPSFVMSCTCRKKKCGHSWFLPVGSKRPTKCPICGTEKPKVSTSDACDYAWFYWGDRFSGIKHL